MDETSIESLLENLKNPDETVRQQATHDLWQLWFQQKGAYGLALLGRSQTLLESGAVNQAEELLTEVIQDQPDFAEAWNRRAVLYYLQKRYRQSLADCEQVLDLNPIHFGAIHGQGLCYLALGEYTAAIQAFRRALEIQPYAIENQRLLLECMAKLS
ncbi:MAG: tetratricopeptide repeat protein [Oculatellaceae cyanobacterium bins.114]|nr:tetratricopeptide repeat protein [Oculatellaceae cyanobacterium bins.114]